MAVVGALTLLLLAGCLLAFLALSFSAFWSWWTSRR